MKKSEHTPERMVAGSAGLGEVSNDLLEKRAHELARIDSRETPNERDRQRAFEELTRMTIPPEAPEENQDVEQLTTWDEPQESTGHQVERVLPEDEANVGETLAEEGLEEADHEQRLASADEEFSESGGEEP